MNASATNAVMNSTPSEPVGSDQVEECVREIKLVSNTKIAFRGQNLMCSLAYYICM